MIEVTKKNGVILMIGFKKRFSPTYRFLKNLFEEEIGKPKWIFIKFALGKVESQWFWDERDGGGPIVENTVHMVDLLHYLVGKVERVYGEGGTLFRKEKSPQIDGALFTLRLENGGVAGIGAGYASEWEIATEEVDFANEISVGGVRGAFDYPFELFYIYRQMPNRIYKKFFPMPDGFKEEIEHFVDCIIKGETSEATGEDGLEALKVTLAVKKSITTGKPVIL